MPVDSTHKSYDRWVPIWERCRDFVDGEDAVKERCRLNNQPDTLRDIRRWSYLPRVSAEQTDAEYLQYLNGASLYAAAGRTVDGLVGAVFRRDPVIELTPNLTYLEERADNAGTPLAMFAKKALRENVAVGGFGILLDMPVLDPMAPSRPLEPFFAFYNTESITMWRERIFPDGKRQTTMVVLREDETITSPTDKFVEICRPRYRVLELDQAGIYQVSFYRKALDAKGKVVRTASWEIEQLPTPMIFEEPIRYIPFEPFGPYMLAFEKQKPVVLDLVNVNVHHFRKSAELNNGLFVTGFPQAVISGFIPLQGEGQQQEFKIGQRRAWLLGQNGAASYLQASGDMGGLVDEMTRDESRMLTLGARLLQPQKREAETAEALRLHQAGESSVLASAADTQSWGMTRVLQWAAEWVGDDPTKNFITLNQEFADTTMTEADAETAMRRWQGGAATLEDLFYLYKQGGRIEPEIEFLQWRRKLEMQAPLPPPMPDFGSGNGRDPNAPMMEESDNGA